jgi:hypothetical protein
MQVVVPSVSLAETLQGAAFTGVRGTISSGALPALAAGSDGGLMGGAAPTVGAAADGGAIIAGGIGDSPGIPGVCCATAGNDAKTMWVTATEKLKVANRIGASFEISVTQRPGRVEVPSCRLGIAPYAATPRRRGGR